MTTCPGCEDEVYADVLEDGERLRCRSCGETAEAAAFADPLPEVEPRDPASFYSRSEQA